MPRAVRGEHHFVARFPTFTESSIIVLKNHYQLEDHNTPAMYKTYPFPLETVSQCHCEGVKRPKQSHKMIKNTDCHAHFCRSHHEG